MSTGENSNNSFEHNDSSDFEADGPNYVDPASATEIEDILDDEAEVYESEMIPDSVEYIEQRRCLLGPIADITHPEFGRENKENENFKVYYRVTPQDNNTDIKSTDFVPCPKVDEYIFDQEGNLVN